MIVCKHMKVFWIWFLWREPNKKTKHGWVERRLKNLPKKRNIVWWRGDLRLAFRMKQSLLEPDSSLPFGVWMRMWMLPFCSSSHISAIDSLYPPPQSSTLSPASETATTSASTGQKIHFSLKQDQKHHTYQPSSAAPPLLIEDTQKEKKSSTRTSRKTERGREGGLAIRGQ